MNESSPSYISLRKVPENFGLIAAKALIQEKLNNQEAVISIGYDQDNDGQLVSTTIIAHLKESSFVTELLSQRCIEIEYESKLYQILLTKPRMNSIDCLQVLRNDVSRRQTTPSRCSSTYDDVFTSFRNRRSVFCARIPSAMFNHQALRNHFERFGPVAKIFLPSNRKLYAIVDFHDHESAMNAILSQGQLKDENHRLTIEWSRGKGSGDTSNRWNSYDGSRGGANRSNYAMRETATGNTSYRRDGDSYPCYGASSGSAIQTNNARNDDARATTTKQVTNWNELLEKEKNFFSAPFQRCVMVPNFPSNLSFDRLRSYFDHYQQNGERIGRIIRLRDGILVEFKDQESADSVLEETDHVIDSVSLQVVPKPIPPVYNHCFLVEGNFESMDTVTAWLECFCNQSEFTLQCHSEHKLYLAKFAGTVEYQELLSFAKRTPLPSIKPKIRELTEPDCVMVKGLTSDVSDDLIKLTFMNKRKSNGGTVTSIQRKPGSSSAVVYFANWQDAVNVVEKGENEQLMVGSCSVQVTLWFNHVTRVPDRRNVNNRKQQNNKNQSARPSTRSTEQSTSNIKTFEKDVDCDYDVIEFIQNTSMHKDNLAKEFSNLATVRFPQKGAGKANTKGLSIAAKFDANTHRVRVRFHPSLKKSDPARFNQVTFEDDCMRTLQGFLAKFDSQKQAYNSANLLALRNSNLWKDSADVIKVEVREGEAVQVFARWDFSSLGSVKITGLSSEVPQVMRWLTKKCDVTEEKVTFLPQNFQILTELEIFKVLCEKFADEDVEITCDKPSQSLILKGSSFAVKQAKQEASKQIKSAGVSRLDFLDQHQINFLKDACDPHSSITKEVLRGMKRQFKCGDVEVKAFLRLQPYFALVYSDESDLKFAKQFLSQYICCREIIVEKNFDQITRTPQWKKLEQNINQTNLGKVRLLINRTDSKLILVGMKSLVDDAYGEIAAHIRDNIVEARKVKVDRSFGLFLKTFPEELQASVHLARLEWEVRDDGNEIFLKGKCLLVAKAVAWIDKEKNGIESREHSVNKPGMCQYFQNSNGKEFLNTTKTVCKCLIFDENVWNSSNEAVSFGPRKVLGTSGQTLLCGTIPQTNVKIHVIRHDITEQRCDAIVNTSNEDLELRNAGVSGAILNKGGRSIQMKMNCEKFNLSNGKLAVGCAVSTTAGSLPCKKIIHVVGPTWSPTNRDQARSQLRQCIFSCLSECDNFGLQSVAIPAISCGVFGGKAGDCVQIIVRSIKKYFEQQQSSVQEIFLIEKDNENVLNEFVCEVCDLAGLNVPSHIKQKTSKIAQVLFASDASDFYPTPSRPLAVSLITGNIADVKADVIVTSCAPENFHSCSGSATSKALLAKAGPNLQNACQQKSSSVHLQAGDVMQTPGYNLSCKEVFHMLLKDYHGSNEEEDLVEAIQVCLLTADSCGYTEIAFPAVGTGGMKYPPEMLAMWFKHQFDDFRGNSLQKATVVLFPSDASTITAFSQIFDSNSISGGLTPRNVIRTPPQKFAAESYSMDAQLPSRMLQILQKRNRVPKSYGVVHSSRQPNKSTSVTYAVKQGNILSSNCDAMICPTSNQQYDLSGAQLSQMLLQKSGQQIDVQRPIHQSSIYRVTNGGNLNFRFLIFVPSPHNSANLTHVLQTVLSFADKTLQVKSLALPAISTGNAGLKSADVARAMATAFQSFEASKPQYLQHVEVVIYEAKKLQHFQSAIPTSSAAGFQAPQPSNQRATASKPVIRPRRSVSSKPSNIIPMQSGTESNLGVTFILCSKNPQNIDKAEKRIQKEVDERSLTKSVSSEVISRLSPDEEEEIMRLEQKHNVVIRRHPRIYEELVVSGLKDDVYKACDSANDIIREYKEALTCAEYVIWKYKDANCSDADEFGIRDSLKLETSYKKNEKGQLQLKVSIEGVKEYISIDFSAMILSSNRHTVLQLERKLQASASAGDGSSSDLPSHWTDMGGMQLQLVALQQNSPEYNQVLKKFTSTGASLGAGLKIERIQNTALYKQFLAQKHKVEARMQQRNVRNPVTRELFHGTNADVCDNIYKDGFDRSHCGKNGLVSAVGVTDIFSRRYMLKKDFYLEEPLVEKVFISPLRLLIPKDTAHKAKMEKNICS